MLGAFRSCEDLAEHEVASRIRRHVYPAPRAPAVRQQACYTRETAAEGGIVSVERVEIDDFNALHAENARALALVWAAVPRWADDIVARRPYASVDDLAECAGRLARSWTGTDLDAALAHHPRIGERPAGAGAEAAASRSEQAAMSTADDDVTARIAAGNRAYEARFGRVFLIRAAGRSPEEMLATLESRLANDDDAEVREALTQLAEIALLRLRNTIHDPAETRMTA